MSAHRVPPLFIRRFSKTVPYEKLTDCDVKEPAGATCLVIQNTLHIVRVDTASSGAGSELALAGLKDPHLFKQCVWAMKKHGAPGVHALLSGAPPPLQQTMAGPQGTATEVGAAAPAQLGMDPRQVELLQQMLATQQQLAADVREMKEIMARKEK